MLSEDVVKVFCRRESAKQISRRLPQTEVNAIDDTKELEAIERALGTTWLVQASGYVPQLEKACLEAVACLLYPEPQPMLDRIKGHSVAVAIFTEESLKEEAADDIYVEMSPSTLQDLNVIVS
jgi:hypothetical protein